MRRMGSVPDAERVLMTTTRAVVCYLDLEHEGWGPYYSRITELFVKVVVFDFATEEGEDVLEIEEYLGNSQSLFVNRDPRVPGNKHHSDEDLRAFPTEQAMLREWLDRMQAIMSRYGEDPVYIVAHNGIVTDVPMLYRALQRAGLPPLNVIGVIDTLPISRELVQWHLNVQPTPEGANDDAETVEASVVPVVDTTPSANMFTTLCAPVYAPQLVHKIASTTAALATSTPKLFTPGVGGLEAELAGDGEAEAAPTDLTHSLTSIYRRLYNNDIDNSHQASADVYAMYEISRSPLFWEVIIGEPVVVKWEWVCTHADELYAKRLNKCRGWGLEHKDYPHCRSHGPMVAEDAFVDVDGQWSVPFRCRNAFNPCLPVTKSTCPTYMEPPATQETIKRRKKADNGVLGACTCAATCRRACPCASGKAKCTDLCHAGSTVCVNKAITVLEGEPATAEAPPREESV
jgi:hypothetical protein